MSTRRALLARFFAALSAGIAPAPPVLSRAFGKPRVDAIFFYGQSNAGAGGHAIPVLTKPVFPGAVLSFRNAQQTYGSTLVDPARLSGVGTVRDNPRYAPLPATATAYALARRRGADAGRRYFMHTVWQGGQSLASFLPGTTAWADLMIAAERMTIAATAAGAEASIAALVIIQGESGPAGRAAYAGMLEALLDDALPALQARTRQPQPPFAILLQTNASAAAPAASLETPLAQWDVAQHDGGRCALAGPMYQFPLSDDVHQSTVGRLMLGDLLALVYETCVEQGRRFEPLHPIAARRDGDVVRVRFRLPQGAGPLRFDSQWTPAAPDFGFAVEGDGRKLAIGSTTIADESEVHIKLANTPRASQLVVRYAMGQPPAAGWAPARGQLAAPTAERSAFASMGLGTPPLIAHYCIRFSLPVT